MRKGRKRRRDNVLPASAWALVFVANAISPLEFKSTEHNHQ